jgi:nondiscriminating glutamyl-tRNA synthetase
MVLLGWNPGETETREILTLDELVSLFTLERVHSSGAVFNIDKFNWMNGEYIKNYDLDKLAELSVSFFENAGFDVSDKDKIKRVLFVIRTKLNKLDDVSIHAAQFYKTELNYTPEQKEILSQEDSKAVIKALLGKIENLSEIKSDNIKPLVQEVQKETGIKGKSLFMPLRLALVAEEHGPDLGLVAYALGKEVVVERLKKIIE